MDIAQHIRDEFARRERVVRYSRGVAEEFARRELYKQSEDNRWITIGGSPSGDKQHAGGTPVRIDGEGRITAGPSSLEGRDLDEFKLKSPKNREPNPSRGPTVQTHADGRKTGITMMTAQELAADPARFQYKVQGISQEGVTQELKEVNEFRPEFGGQLLAWHDPNNGQTYVINGHHRHELARRTGYEHPLPVYLIDAQSDAEARALGALANIAEGRGTAVDAAKFLRETGRGVDALRQEGVSMKGRVADEASQLATLSDNVFNHIVNERIPDKWGVSMARHVDNHDAQDQMLRTLVDADRKGRNLSDGVVEEMAREFGFAPTRSETSRSLFGDMEETRSLVVERATVKNSLRRALSSEARTFQEVGRRGRGERLAEAGNVLNQEENLRRAGEASALLESFDRWTKYKGDVSDAVNKFAEQLADNPRKERDILRQAERELRPLLQSVDERAMGTAGQTTSPYSRAATGVRYARAWPMPSRSMQIARMIQEEFARRLHYRRDRIPGGLGDTAKASDFDREQVAKGIRVEMEHTSDPRTALEIALDHLSENPRYYDELSKLNLSRMLSAEFARRRHVYGKFVESEHPRDASGKFVAQRDAGCLC